MLEVAGGWRRIGRGKKGGRGFIVHGKKRGMRCIISSRLGSGMFKHRPHS